MNIQSSVISAALLATLAGHALAQTVVPATLVNAVGDQFGTDTIAEVNTPYSGGPNNVYYVTKIRPTADEGAVPTSCIFRGSTPLFRADSQPSIVATSIENFSCGGNGTDYAFSPATIVGASNYDSIWTSAGLLIREGDPAPGIPGRTIRFASGPTMAENGAVAFVAGLNNTSNASQGRAFYICNPATVAGAQLLVKAGDIVAGQPLPPIPQPDIMFDYDMSNNADYAFLVLQLIPSGTTARTSHVLATRGSSGWTFSIVAQVGAQVPGENLGDTWGTLSTLSVANDGTTAVGGVAAGAGALAINGQIVAGAWLDDVATPRGRIGGPTGTALGFPASCLNVGLDDSGNIYHLWSYTPEGGGAVTRTLFWGPANNMAANTKIVSKGDFLDTNGDTIGDEEVMDIPTPTRRSTDVGTGVVHMLLTLRNVSTNITRAGVVSFTTFSNGPTCNDLDFNNDGNIEPLDVDAYFSILGEGPCLPEENTCSDLDFNNDGNIEPRDVDAYFSLLGEGPCLQ